jgi:hypothetical protein
MQREEVTQHTHYSLGSGWRYLHGATESKLDMVWNALVFLIITKIRCCVLRIDLGAPLQGKDDMKYQAAQRSIP